MAKNNKKLRRSLLSSALIVVVAVVGLFLMSSSDGKADQTTTAAATTPAETDATTAFGSSEIFTDGALPTLAKMVGALFLVIICIYVGIYLLKKTMGGKYTKGNRVSALEVLESTGVGPKQNVTLIRVGDKAVLVGITGERMALLTELTAEDTAALMTATPVESEPDAFSKMLSSAAMQMKKFTSKNRRTVLES